MSESFDGLVDRVRNSDASPAGDERVVAMFRQDAPHFGGLSAGQADRLRGRMLAALEHRLLSADTVHAVKEELRTSLSPVVLAGAARALRSIANTDLDCRPLLQAAFERIATRDEVVGFDAASSRPQTALGEIAAAIALFPEARAQCCGTDTASSTGAKTRSAKPLCPGTLRRVLVEDQSEQLSPLLDVLKGRTSLIAFFYTRCMNPTKCSLTISRLGNLARLVAERSADRPLNVLAISYDPDFDSPSRLYAFGHDRGFPFSGDAKLVRCVSHWDTASRMFDLRVGYNDSTVNAHAREAFIVSPELQAVSVDCERLSDPHRLLVELGSSWSGEEDSSLGIPGHRGGGREPQRP